MRWLPLLTLLACSAPDVSLAGEAGCNSADNRPGDDCGSEQVIYARTVCAIPVLKPWNQDGCHSPDGHDFSTIWCCSGPPP